MKRIIARFSGPGFFRGGFWSAGMAFAGLSGLVSLAMPLVAKFVVDEGLMKKDPARFFLLAGLSAGIYLAGELAARLRDWYKQSIKLKFDFQLNKKLFCHMQGLPLAWFRDRASASNLFTIANDVSVISDFIIDDIPGLFVSIARLLCVTVIAFWLDWRLTLISLVFSPLLYLPQHYLSTRLRALRQSFSDICDDIYCYLEEKLSHMQLVKTMAKEKNTSRGYVRRLVRRNRVALANSRVEILSDFSADLISKAVLGCIGLYAGLQVIRGNMSPGTLAAVTLYLGQMIGLLSGIFAFKTSSVSAAVSCGRVSAILDEPQIRDSRQARDIARVSRPIIFERVSFGYRPDALVLRDISLNIPAGGFVALVGASGCGKSTLLNLIMRMYEPGQGSIRFGDGDIRSIKRRSLASCVGFAFQEPFLWNDTVANNIRYGREEASFEEIVAAAKTAQADGFVRGFAHGYDTPIGENACKLSEGQKQKIALARALINNPVVLILDEAMASMDSRSEEKALAAIRGKYPSMTLIVVSHRLSTIRAADNIFYLAQDGELKQGRCNELLEDNEDFRGLFGGQTTGGGYDLGR